MITKNNYYFDEYIAFFNTDTALNKRVELNAQTKMSLNNSVMSVKDYIETAARWGWKAVAITDICTVEAFPEARQVVDLGKLDIKIIYGMKVCMEGDTWEQHVLGHAVILVKNSAGLRNLYKIVTLSLLEPCDIDHCISKKILQINREGILLGSAGMDGELVRAIASQQSNDNLLEIADFYDYLEIQPIDNYAALIDDVDYPNISSDEDLREINRKIVELAKTLDKPFVATGDVRYLRPEDNVCRNFIAIELEENLDIRGSQFLRTTDDMLENFMYLGKATAFDAVVYNPRRIVDMIEDIVPIPEGTHLPVLPNADESIENISYEMAHKLYGKKLPAVVETRLTKELKNIINHGYSSVFLIWHTLVKKIHERGYHTIPYKFIASSFVAYLVKITDINPLPPHWRCPECQYSEFVTDGTYMFGTDLPNRDCPHCGKRLVKDGYDMPYEIFFGDDHIKSTEMIEIGFPYERKDAVFSHIKQILGQDKVFHLGLTRIISDKYIFLEVQSYLENMDKERLTEVFGHTLTKFHYNGDDEYVQRFMEKRLHGVKVSNDGLHGQLVVIPQNMDSNDFTPLLRTFEKYDDGWLTTLFDKEALGCQLMLLSVPVARELDVLKKLEEKTECMASDISLDDVDTLSLLCSGGTPGIVDEDCIMSPDIFDIVYFGLPDFSRLLSKIKPNSFSEFVKVYGLSLRQYMMIKKINTEELISSGLCNINDAIGSREDVMTYLIRKGIEPIKAAHIMENVRRGKGISKHTRKMLKAHDIPDWYINSCQKIYYLHSRAQFIGRLTVSYQLAYYKVHYPEEFYRAYIESFADESDMDVIKDGKNRVQDELNKLKDIGDLDEDLQDKLKILKIAQEMYIRGYTL